MSSHPNAQSCAHPSIGFNGQLHESNCSWQLLGNGHRAYNPVLMRFHSPDLLSPMGKGGINAYTYCGNDPSNRIDPTGAFGLALGMLSLFTVGGVAVAVAAHTDDELTRNIAIGVAVAAVGAGVALGVVQVAPALRRSQSGSILSIPRSSRRSSIVSTRSRRASTSSTDSSERISVHYQRDVDPSWLKGAEQAKSETLEQLAMKRMIRTASGKDNPKERMDLWRIEDSRLYLDFTRKMYRDHFREHGRAFRDREIRELNHLQDLTRRDLVGL